MLLTAAIAAGCGRVHPSHGRSVRATEPTDQAVCTTINGYFFYPTIPATGETVLPGNAVQVATLLRSAHAQALRGEAGPLEAAMSANDEQGVVAIFQKLQSGICSTLGVPPPT